MYRNILFTFSCLLLNASFYNKSETPCQVVLQTGKISITEYELEKNFHLFLSDFTREKGARPTDSAIANWIHAFIDRTYFLADACNKGYDTAADVNKWVESMAHYVVSKPDGLLSKQLQQEQAGFAASVKAQSQITINTPVWAKLISYLKQAATSQSNNEYTAGDPFVLFWYKRGDTVQPVTTTRFMKYYNTLPLRKEMVQEEALHYYANEFVYDQYAWDKAEADGITRSWQFRLDENNYRNNVMWARYENIEMRSGITVSEEELRNRYEADKDSFNLATDVVVSAYSFNNRQEAISAIINIRTGKTSEMGSGLQPVYTHKSIHYREALFSDSIRNVVFSMKRPGFVMSFSYNGKFVIIIKEAEQGRRVANLPEVRLQLIKVISAEKLAEKEKEELQRLKKLFTSTNTIDYQKYFHTLPGKKG